MPGSRRRSEVASSCGTPSSKSNSDVVITVRTSTSGTTSRATSSHSVSSVTSATAPESLSNAVSSLRLSIGLTETMIPPAFQVATIAIGNCGTFCK